MISKQAVIQQIEQSILEKEQSVLTRFNSLQDSLLNETKSSAGDKHEIGRASVQLEMEKMGAQLSSIKKEKELLFKIKEDEKPAQKVGFGTLVQTKQNIYFFGLSIGKITVEKKDVFAVSLASPIGKAFLNKQAGEEVQFLNKIHHIVEVG